MSSSLIGLGQLVTHEQAFVHAATELGFSSLGEIDRFLFKAYGKALRLVPSANRPRGAIFILEPAIWIVPDKYLLVPKPELLMSRGFGKFLRTRMAGYRYHADETYVENSGRADIVLTHLDGRVYLIEVKWTGRSLSGKRQNEAEDAIIAALTRDENGWFTTYDDSTFDDGIKQLKIYFRGASYDKTFLVVFDCCATSDGRGHERRAIDPAHVAPHPLNSFCAIRACVDPRKASKASKS